MDEPMEKNASALMRLIPPVDDILRTKTAAEIASESGLNQITNLIRSVAEEFRNELIGNTNESADSTQMTREAVLAEIEKRLTTKWKSETRNRMQKVINTTGVIIHTNLGRAPLSPATKTAIFDTAAGYCNLEYDLATGQRGKRGKFAESLLGEVCGAEDAVIVNNCAAAAFFVLSVFGRGGDVIISRGELVEIGGDFRVPDVLEQSCAVLREVGTTNRTKIGDYEKAISENTKLILRVHPSNYKITGFTETPRLRDIAELAHRNGLIIYEDAGSGALIDLAEFGLSDEPLISRSIAEGADIVSFSGDKLMGGIQAGLIAGRKDLIGQLRKHPLYRALRPGKLTYAAIEATLASYARGTAIEEIPVLKMFAATHEQIEQRTHRMLESIRSTLDPNSRLNVEMIEGNSVIGGGAAPGVEPKTLLISLSHNGHSADELAAQLRESQPPIVARIEDDKVVIDLRTVFAEDETALLNAVAALA